MKHPIKLDEAYELFNDDLNDIYPEVEVLGKKYRYLPSHVLVNCDPEAYDQEFWNFVESRLKDEYDIEMLYNEVECF